MLNLKSLAAVVVLATLSGCSVLQLEPPTSLRDQVVYAETTITALATATSGLIESKKLSGDTARKVVSGLINASKQLDLVYEFLLDGDTKGAQSQILLVQKLLREIDKQLTKEADI